MPNAVYIALIPLLPLAGFLILALFGRKYFRKSSGIIATVLLLAATILAIYTAYSYFFGYGKVNGVYEKLVPLKYTWLQFSKGISIDMGVLLDPITCMMLVVVTFVSLMVHIYSLAYMKGEERFATYYSFLGLFTFSMLALVISSNIFQIYIFWELVGVSSFSLSAPEALQLVAYVGAISALIAAIIACTQTDIKRVLAFSTMSQIGYMMFALGVSKYGGEDGLGYTASMFHLFTHAMFKALLFLGAGAIIHFIHSNEMKDMGGLRKHLPITHITFLIACLAISGIPPFAGFFSKEEILLAAWQQNMAIYWVALFTSGLTAFYMFRLYFSIFWNKEHHPHGEHHGEGGFVMMLPLVLLAIGAAAAGFIPFGNFVTSDGKALESEFHLQLSIVPVLFGLIGIFIAMWLYKKQNNKPDKIAASINGLYKAAYHKFYFDEMYLFITKKVLFNLVGKPAAWFLSLIHI